MNSARKFIGEAAHCLNLAEELRQRGHETLLVVRRGYELESHAEKAGVPKTSLSMQGHFHPINDWKDCRALHKLIGDFRPDVIHCHRGKDHWLAATALVFGSRVPIVRTRHVVIPMRQHVFNRWLLSRATAQIIAVSEPAAQSLGGMRGSLSHKLIVIHSAVNNTRFNPVRRDTDWRRERAIPDDAPLIGMFARIQNIKGQHVFIEAAVEVVRDFPNARFLIAGRGSPPRVEDLRNQAARLGVLDHFIFEGWLDRVETAIASLDIGVIASLGSEGSSRVTLEFMASGIPVVATSVGIIPEIIKDHETGVIVDPGNAKELAIAINDYLARPDFARGVAETAMKRAHSYHCTDRWVGDVLTAFSKAVAEGKRN